MKVTYCKKQKIVTVKLTKDEFYSLCDETERSSDREMVYEIMDRGNESIDNAQIEERVRMVNSGEF